MDDEGFYLRKGRRENVVISLSLSLSLSLSEERVRERERGGTRAANTTREKSFGLEQTSRVKSPARGRKSLFVKCQRGKMRCENSVKNPKKKLKRANTKAKEYFVRGKKM